MYNKRLIQDAADKVSQQLALLKSYGVNTEIMEREIRIINCKLVTPDFAEHAEYARPVSIYSGCAQ
jgi:hypothetical protein